LKSIALAVLQERMEKNQREVTSMMLKMTKGQIEASISEAIIKFEREHMGRGPKETRTYIIQDMLFIRLKGVLTPAEQQLAKDTEGKLLVKQARYKLVETSRGLLERIVSDITGEQVISLHTDISTKTGERIIIFTLESDLEAKISK